MNSLLCSLLLVLLICGGQCRKGEPTRVVFYVEQETDTAQDYMQMILEVKVYAKTCKQGNAKLSKSVADAQSIISKYCLNHEKPENCENISSSKRSAIEPLYTLTNNTPNFQHFQITHQITANITYPDKIGELVDTLTTDPHISVSNIQWKSIDPSVDHLDLIKKAKKRATQRCSNLGLTLSQIDSIQDIADFQLEIPSDQSQEAPIESPSYLLYKFAISCR